MANFSDNLAAFLNKKGISIRALEQQIGCFRYDEENGITFTAPDFYVEKLKDRLVYAHGCSVRPIIKEIK